MKVEIMSDKLTSPRDEARLVGYWPNSGMDGDVPIYHVDTFHELNRLVGYAKFINSSNGTVLYRGQNKDYGQLIPSGVRPHKKVISTEIVEKICKDKDNRLPKFFQLTNSDIAGWKEYQQVIVEAVIQHYGGNTYCLDFVDNHWCALWFGTYTFEDNHYHCRHDDDNNLYIYLYLADTNGSVVRGMYIGEYTYTVDLRKALPSTFQRPASQHGWVVRKKNNFLSDCNYNDNVVGVLEVTVKDAKKWLGNGFLLSEENFFPSFNVDQGYRVLLERQYQSGLFSSYEKILPPKTIKNYHFADTFYYSDRSVNIYTIKHLQINGVEVKNIDNLYLHLLNTGWQKNTLKNQEQWDEKEPWKNQSAITAALIYRYFGGDIYCRSYSNALHYFNIINDVTIDLTFQELHSFISCGIDFYCDKVIRANADKTISKFADNINTLFYNCKITDNIPKQRKGMNIRNRKR